MCKYNLIYNYYLLLYYSRRDLLLFLIKEITNITKRYINIKMTFAKKFYYEYE